MERGLVRALLCGEPGTGKTGSVAALLNTGRYVVRMLDLDGNNRALLRHTKPEYLGKLDIVSVEEELVWSTAHIATRGQPRAFERAIRLCGNWSWTDPATGEEVKHGGLYDWGPETVLLVDSLTALGRRAMENTLYREGRLEKGARFQDWGLAAKDQEALVELVTSAKVKCHVLVTSHIKLIGPPQEAEGDTLEQREAKAKVAEKVQWTMRPSALGQKLPAQIGQHFDYVLLYEVRADGRGNPRRVIRTRPSDGLAGIRVPDEGALEPELGVADGLARLFDAVRTGPSAASNSGGGG